MTDPELIYREMRKFALLRNFFPEATGNWKEDKFDFLDWYIARHYGTHVSHCCFKHGCKYGEDCPVELKDIKQEFPCEICDEEAEEKKPLLEFLAKMGEIEWNDDMEEGFLRGYLCAIGEVEDFLRNE